ncbi:MAG: hypothetical protein ACYTXA_21200 [Nostoc sp.]
MNYEVAHGGNPQTLSTRPRRSLLPLRDTQTRSKHSRSVSKSCYAVGVASRREASRTRVRLTPLATPLGTPATQWLPLGEDRTNSRQMHLPFSINAIVYSVIQSCKA